MRALGLISCGLGVGPPRPEQDGQGLQKGRGEGGVPASGHILNYEDGTAYLRNTCGMNLQVELGW